MTESGVHHIGDAISNRRCSERIRTVL